MKTGARAFAASLVLALSTAACTSAPAAPAPPPSSVTVPAATTTAATTSPKVAFIRDLSIPDADEHALPAFQGAQLAFQTAVFGDPNAIPVQLVLVDVAEDPEALEAIQADPSVVAAIIAPGVEVDAVGDVPPLSLSGLVPASGSGLRLVPPIGIVARSLARSLPPGACIFSEDPPPDRFGALVGQRSGETPEAIDAAEAAALVSARGCGTVAWVGGPDRGAEAAISLEGSDVRFVGGDRLLDYDFLAEAGIAAEGARAVCPCADVSTSTDLAARRFIQDYQSEFGSAPAAYSVEGWDAAHLVLRAIRQAGATRPDVASWLGAVAAHDGLSSVYRFDTDGELLFPVVRTYRVVGGRWMSAPA